VPSSTRASPSRAVALVGGGIHPDRARAPD